MDLHHAGEPWLGFELAIVQVDGNLIAVHLGIPGLFHKVDEDPGGPILSRVEAGPHPHGDSSCGGLAPEERDGIGQIQAIPAGAGQAEDTGSACLAGGYRGPDGHPHAVTRIGRVLEVVPGGHLRRSGEDEGGEKDREDGWQQ